MIASSLSTPGLLAKGFSSNTIAEKLGWTQEEIAPIIGVSGTGAVTEILKKFNSKLFEQEYESGMTPEKIAENHNLDQALIWAISSSPRGSWGFPSNE